MRTMRIVKRRQLNLSEPEASLKIVWKRHRRGYGQLYKEDENKLEPSSDDNEVHLNDNYLKATKNVVRMKRIHGMNLDLRRAF